MHTRYFRVFQDAGLSDETAEQFATLIVAPPPGTFDASELENADDVRICLLGAIVAATRHWEFGEALVKLLRFASKGLGQMSTYDQGRFWHLKGFAAWRLCCPRLRLTDVSKTGKSLFFSYGQLSGDKGWSRLISRKKIVRR